MKKSHMKLGIVLIVLSLIFSMVGCGQTVVEESIWVDGEGTTSIITHTSGSSETSNVKNENDDVNADVNLNEENSKNESTSQNESGSQDTSNKIDMESLKGKTITILMWRELTNQEKNTVEKFKKETSMNVSIETTNWSNYMTKLASMVSTGDSPDVAIIPTEQSSQGCFPLGTATLFQPISVSKQDLNDDFWDIKSMDKFKIKGHHFAFIAYNNWYDCNGVVMYNVDMFKDAKITTPRELWKAGNWNWDTLKSTATELVKKGHIGYQNQQYYNLMQSMGVDFVTTDGNKFTSAITSKEVINAWTFNAQMVEAGLQPAYGTESSAFGQGKAGMIGTNLWNMRKEADFGNLTFEVDAVPFPGPKGGKNIIPANVNLFAIPKGSKNPVGGGVFIREFLDSKNNGKFADVAINANMEDVFNYVTGKDVEKGYKFAIGVVGYTNLTNLKTLEKTLAQTASNQITTVLQKNKSLVDNAVNTVNNKLK